jgi:hypothetical protein
LLPRKEKELPTADVAEAQHPFLRTCWDHFPALSPGTGEKNVDMFHGGVIMQIVTQQEPRNPAMTAGFVKEPGAVCCTSH